MTPAERLTALRQELVLAPRVAELLRECAKDWADEALRRSYEHLDPAILNRQAGIAEGAEKFIHTATAAPTRARKAAE